ncbi:hypothetical protein B0T10DRAFT_611351 [Thelonectria olida]|uniref:LysM domain-containing protein n=1 Tax=Thelonectria olida TaxID=1576542 RepID=A0A9P9AIK8_9HYPO|nr:hypothetical protein B0T10DRAFT_611351 [Thelonectria olida]
MRFILTTLFASLLSVAAAQQFSDLQYDYDIDEYTEECKTSMNQTLKCSSLLGDFEADSVDLSAADLTELCTSSCNSSLVQLQEEINKACPKSSNSITIDGETYAATNNINSFVDTYNQLCLVDPDTKKFCYDLTRSWPSEDKMNSSQKCSYCHLKLLQVDQSSEFNYEEALASSFSSLTKSCGKTSFEPSTPTGSNLGSNASFTTTASATVTQSCASTYTITSEDTCNGICKSHNVSTYSLTQLNGLLVYCRDLPKAGTKLLAKKFGNKFSVTQLISWNPQLNDLCTNMPQQEDMQICVGAPGLSNAVGTNTQAPADSPTATMPAPTNAANGTKVCAKYYNVSKGDSCASISQQAGITLQEFYFLNPSINSNCTNLLFDISYCIQAVGDVSTYSGYVTTATRCTAATCYTDGPTFTPVPPRTWTVNASGVPVPVPVKTTRTKTSSRTAPASTWTPLPLANGTYGSDKCANYLVWGDTGDDDLNEELNSCDGIVEYVEITMNQLLEWNPSLKNEDPCSIKKGFRYCFALLSSKTSTPVSASSTSHQSTTIASTSTEEKATSTVRSTTTTKDTTTTEEKATSTEKSTTTTKASSTATKSSGIETPSPSADKMTSGCTKFYKVQSGDYCYKICEDNKISQEDFIKWNPSVKSDCSVVEKGVYYCIAT